MLRHSVLHFLNLEWESNPQFVAITVTVCGPAARLASNTYYDNCISNAYSDFSARITNRDRPNDLITTHSRFSKLTSDAVTSYCGKRYNQRFNHSMRHYCDDNMRTTDDIATANPTVRSFSRKTATSSSPLPSPWLPSPLLRAPHLPALAPRQTRIYKSPKRPSTSTQTHGVLRRGRLARASALLGTCRPIFTITF